MEQFISHIRVELVDNISCLQDYERGVISLSEVCELLTEIHDIVDSAVSKQVCKTTHILVHIFNSSFRQHHELCASQYPCLHSLKDVISPGEACLFGCINWSLAQAQQESSRSFSQSFCPMRDGKARPMTGFHFNV